MKKKFFFVTMLLASLSVGNMVYASSETGTAMEAVTEAAPKETEAAQPAEYTPGNPAEISKEEIMGKMKENLQTLTSIRTGLEVNLTGVLRMGWDTSETGMELTMNMKAALSNEEIYEPYQAHSTEEMTIELFGQTETMKEEKYVRNEDGQIVEYKGRAGADGQVASWERDTEDDLDFFFNRNGDFLNEMPELTLNANKMTDAGGKEFYLLEGQLDMNAETDGESLSDQVDELLDGMEEGLGDIELPDQLPMSFYVSADELLPYELIVDASGIKGIMDADEAEYAAEVEFSELTVGMYFRDYNGVSEIAFPENLGQSAPVNQPVSEQSPETTVPETTASETAVPKEGGSAAYSPNGAIESPLALNEMGKAFVYNSESGEDEAAGLTVTSVKGGEEVAKYVDELLNGEDSYYTFPALRRTEEYRLVSYDIYLPPETTDSEYGLYSPNCHFEVVGTDGDYLYINERSYYASTTDVYGEDGEYHPGDTVHCETVIVMPKDVTEYVLKFGSYDTEPLYVKVA